MRNVAHFFPVRMPPGARGIIMVPWELMEMHGRQASSNHQGRSLEELQGSLDCSEICAVLDDRAWYPMDDALARLQVIAAIRGFDPPPSMISPGVEAAAIALLREHFGDNMTWAEAPEKMRNAWRKKRPARRSPHIAPSRISSQAQSWTFTTAT
jgi:hypothetical protein